jgi:hypothetical protein
MVQNLISFLYKTLVNLNIFPSRDFGNNINPITRKSLNQWATRLFFFLFIIGLIILTLYTMILPQLTTKIFDKPSFEFYKNLKEKYLQQLKCPCSSLASTYDQFVHIQPTFHQV